MAVINQAGSLLCFEAWCADTAVATDNELSVIGLKSLDDGNGAVKNCNNSFSLRRECFQR